MKPGVVQTTKGTSLRDIQADRMRQAIARVGHPGTLQKTLLGWAVVLLVGYDV